jgi:hypothetical protein
MIFHEYRLDSDFMNLDATHVLCEKAKKYYVPIPPKDNSEYWEITSMWEDQKVLTSQGIFQLKNLTEIEEKKNRERYMLFGLD